MNVLVIRNPGEAAIEQVREPSRSSGSVLLKVRMVGLCGSDLNSFRGLNPLVSFPRIPGHEVSATILEGDYLDGHLSVGAFRAAVEEVAFTGRVVYIGYAKEPLSYETKFFVQKELDILGARNAQPEDFHAVIQLLEAGKFPVDQAVSLIVPLEKAPEALRSWTANPSQFTKILVSLD